MSMENGRMGKYADKTLDDFEYALVVISQTSRWISIWSLKKRPSEYEQAEPIEKHPTSKPVISQ